MGLPALRRTHAAHGIKCGSELRMRMRQALYLDQNIPKMLPNSGAGFRLDYSEGLAVTLPWGRYEQDCCCWRSSVFTKYRWSMISFQEQVIAKMIFLIQKRLNYSTSSGETNTSQIQLNATEDVNLWLLSKWGTVGTIYWDKVWIICNISALRLLC